MPTFEYNALTSSGRAMTGTIEAASNTQAAELLTEMKLTVNEIKQTKQSSPKTHIGRNEFVLFNQQLESITKAGIPLEQGLKELAKDVSSLTMSKLINEIVNDLQLGLPIEKALEKRRGSFTPLYTEIISAGTKTGRLPEMLTALNRHLELKTKTRRIIIESLTYPIVVISIFICIMSLIFMFVIPTFSEILCDMSDGMAGLPLLTQIFLQISQQYYKILAGIAIIVGLCIAVYLILSSSTTGRRFKETVFLKYPLIGRLCHANILARLSESMALLINANLPLADVLRLSADTTESENLKLECGYIASSIEQGANILETGYGTRIIPNLFLYSIQLGAQRNQLCDNLHSLGQMYYNQTNSLQARLQALLTPILIIVLGSFVGMGVVAMFLPMIQMTTVLM